MARNSIRTSKKWRKGIKVNLQLTWLMTIVGQLYATIKIALIKDKSRNSKQIKNLSYTVSEIAIKTSMNMYFLYVIYYLIIGKIYKKHVSSMLELVTV